MADQLTPSAEMPRELAAAIDQRMVILRQQCLGMSARRSFMREIEDIYLRTLPQVRP